jgi:hypothetical protein
VNKDPKENRSADEKSRSLLSSRPAVFYVYHLGQGGGGPYPAYLLQNERDDPVEDKVKWAIDNVLENRVPEVLRDPGTDFIHWRAYSYLVFVMEGIIIEDVAFEDLGPTPTPNKVNFTYVDRIENYRGCSAVFYVNERINRKNKPLQKHESEPFEWTAIHPERKVAKGLLSHDGSGTNTGP